MKQIIIEIDNEGNCTLEGKGFIGPECEKSIQEIQNILGCTKTSQKKDEYHQRTRTNTKNVERNQR